MVLDPELYPEEARDYPGMGQYLRPDGNPSPFTSIPVAIYWCMVTMSTVGYGDMFPITPWGYVVGSITIIGGCVLLFAPSTALHHRVSSPHPRTFRP